MDDEDIVRESLCDWLSSVGYKVLAANNGEEALRIIKEKNVKIMIADLIMPGMNGLELMKKARDIVPTISTVIITAHGTIQTAISAIREGAYDYVEKPFCPEKVELIIRNLVEHHSLVEENISLRRKVEDQYSFEGIIAKSPKMTKIFESSYQGTLQDICCSISNEEPRGEYTLVVEGSSAETDRPLQVDAEAYVRGLVELRELSTKDAIRQAASELEIPRRELYNLVMAKGKNG